MLRRWSVRVLIGVWPILKSAALWSPFNLRQSVRFALVLAACALCVPASSAPKKSAPRPDPGVPAVEKVLRDEIAGEVDRRGRLADTLASHPESAAARWQSGFVREENTWRPFDDPSSAAGESQSLKEYRDRRSDGPHTFQGQLELANWCRQHELADQERAHLWAALELAGDQDGSDVVRRLGFVLVGNRWLNRQDLSTWQRQIRTSLDSVKRFGPRLEKIAQQLEGSDRQRELAARELKRLNDPDVIPAVEYVLCGREHAARLAVAALARFGESAASLALARQAAFSSLPDVRSEASAALKPRRFEDFVPDLVGLLSAPARVEGTRGWRYSEDLGQFAGGPVSLAFASSYLIARETEDQFRVELLNTLDNRLTELLAAQGTLISFRLATATGEFELTTSSGGRRLVRDLGRSILSVEQTRTDGDRLHAVQSAVDAENARTEDLNRRIINVLAVLSGRDATDDVQSWWRWWADYTDTTRIGDKPVVVQRVDETIGDPTARFTRLSCFAAGTPVWTDRGLAAIESVKVGDRVLSQDIESGELAYKPVIKATVRPPKELTTLRFGDEAITCTGGHRFWACGEGWIKARDLKSHVILHTVTGNTLLSSAKPGQTAQTHNLVVADFHTYFVGKTGVLCQDLLIPQGTNVLVPGLPRARTAATRQK